MIAVVAVDGVNDAPVKLASKLGVAKGTFVHVIPGPGGELLHENVEKAESFIARRRAEQELAPRYQREGWTFEVVESPHEFGRALCDFAENAKADLLVVGHSSRTWVEHLLMGSVAVYVTKHATCSVLVAK
jgi:nucleotide-binding universal stress UspA family protein